MAITLYKNGKTTTKKTQSGANYMVSNYGWSLTPPASATPAPKPTPTTPTPTLTPTTSTPAKDISNQEVWKDGKKTTVQAWEVPSYLAKGYTSNYVAPTETPPAETPPKPPTIPTEISTDVLNTPVTTEDIQAQVSNPVEGLQQVFGADWKPAPIFDQLGLTQQGIYGAVRIKGMNDVYTIGPGGRKETADSYKERFGTDSQEGIVGEISMEQAKKLGIVVDANSIIDPIIPKDPYEIWGHFRDEDKAKIDKMRTKLTEATQTLIDTMKNFGKTKTEAKDKEKKDLGIDAKDKAITDAQKIRADVFNSYSELLLKNRGEKFMSRILGTESRIIAQRAIELAPLDSNILIAQNAYSRAKDLLDEWSADYNESMKWQMQAAQTNINMMTGNLNREQTENLAEAQIKFNIWQNEQKEQKATQKEVQSLMLAYNSRGANININDTWEDALRKTMPYTKSDQDILDRLNKLKLESAGVDLLLKKKNLAKPYWKPSSDTTKIDYTSPLLQIYTQATGKTITSDKQAQQIAGLAETALGGKETVADDFIGPLTPNQIKESEAANIISDTFKKTFVKETPPSDSKWEREATVWQWLETDEGKNLSDEEKASQIRSYGLNPETFGIY